MEANITDYATARFVNHTSSADFSVDQLYSIPHMDYTHEYSSDKNKDCATSQWNNGYLYQQANPWQQCGYSDQYYAEPFYQHTPFYSASSSQTFLDEMERKYIAPKPEPSSSVASPSPDAHSSYRHSPEMTNSQKFHDAYTPYWNAYAAPEPVVKRQTTIQNNKVQTAVPKQSSSYSKLKMAVSCHDNSKCSNCGTTETTLWRRNSIGEVECNACNLYFRKNNRKRPLALLKKGILKRKRNPRFPVTTATQPAEQIC
ncbi:GATA zinc finger domain-containing protein [Ditylenchus destructor]|nr:GATA zinc finger domain-containing protein [Ditylenchus destructor]